MQPQQPFHQPSCCHLRASVIYVQRFQRSNHRCVKLNSKQQCWAENFWYRIRSSCRKPMKGNFRDQMENAEFPKWLQRQIGNSHGEFENDLIQQVTSAKWQIRSTHLKSRTANSKHGLQNQCKHFKTETDTSRAEQQCRIYSMDFEIKTLILAGIVRHLRPPATRISCADQF